MSKPCDHKISNACQQNLAHSSSRQDNEICTADRKLLFPNLTCWIHNCFCVLYFAEGLLREKDIERTPMGVHKKFARKT